MRQRVCILGSTGSIGRNALQVLRQLADDFEVVGLAAGSRWQDMMAQAREFKVAHLAIGRPEYESQLQGELNAEQKLYSGEEGLVELIEHCGCDCVLSAIVGTAGLMATVRAVEMGKKVALANKETLVVTGPVITELARQTGAQLIPVDSEHSAIFQALHAGSAEEIHRLYLTSSGGPFRTWTLEQMKQATPADALAHPVWNMGPKITIDSATMMNKALEIVEARWLFNVTHDQIEVLIHPEAIIHSMVEFRDGCLIAQLGTPDMRIPIQYALTYPRRLERCGEPLDLLRVRQLRFEPPDRARYPALELGFQVARQGGSSGAVLNAANEAAVEAFQAGRIHFGEITERTMEIVGRHKWIEHPTLEQLLAADRWARNEVHACLTC